MSDVEVGKWSVGQGCKLGVSKGVDRMRRQIFSCSGSGTSNCHTVNLHSETLHLQLYPYIFGLANLVDCFVSTTSRDDTPQTTQATASSDSSGDAIPLSLGAYVV